MKCIYTVFAAIIVSLIMGCGREYHIRGRVIALEGTVKSGSIIEVTGRGIPENGKSVAGATVTVFYQLKEDGTPVEEGSWHRSIVTDDKGMFDLRDYSVPSTKMKVGIRVAKDGFETVYTVYWDHKEIEPQDFFAELKPSGSR